MQTFQLILRCATFPLVVSFPSSSSFLLYVSLFLFLLRLCFVFFLLFPPPSPFRLLRRFDFLRIGSRDQFTAVNSRSVIDCHSVGEVGSFVWHKERRAPLISKRNRTSHFYDPPSDDGVRARFLELHKNHKVPRSEVNYAAFNQDWANASMFLYIKKIDIFLHLQYNKKVNVLINWRSSFIWIIFLAETNSFRAYIIRKINLFIIERYDDHVIKVLMQ